MYPTNIHEFPVFGKQIIITIIIHWNLHLNFIWYHSFSQGQFSSHAANKYLYVGTNGSNLCIIIVLTGYGFTLFTIGWCLILRSYQSTKYVIILKIPCKISWFHIIAVHTNNGGNIFSLVLNHLVYDVQQQLCYQDLGLSKHCFAYQLFKVFPRLNQIPVCQKLITCF